MEALKDSAVTWLNLFLSKENRAKNGAATGAFVAICYLAFVRYLRYRGINALKRKYPDPILALRDPAIAEEVYNLTVRKDFPFVSRTALELALFRTYSVPSISKLLYATSEFSKETRRRAEDTELILLEIADAYIHIERIKKDNGAITQEEIEEQRQRPKIAVKRLNELHGKYNISNGDFLYTLSLFIVQPIKWINQYEWRKLEPIEMNAIFRIWYDIGVSMNIKDIPNTLDAMFEFNEQYAKDNVRYASTNWKVGQPTVEHLLSRFPKMVGPLAYKIIPAVLDPIDVKGFGLEPPKTWAKNLVSASFFIRSLILRHLALPRFNALMRTPVKPDPKTNMYKPIYNIYEPTYPNGYCIYELGPEKRKPLKCPIPH